MHDKGETFHTFKRLPRRLTIESCSNIVRIRTNSCKEFENKLSDDYCFEHGIEHEFYAHKTHKK